MKEGIYMAMIIKKMSMENAEKYQIKNALWGYTKYTPEVYVSIVYDDEGFIVKFHVNENEPTRTKTEHFEPVHLDSCVEFFVDFDPEHSDKYINFETNANGAMNVAFRSDRHNFERLKIAEIEKFNITPEINGEYWTLTYKIGFDFIKNYYPEFDIQKTKYVKGNIYKCGDETPVEHYMSYFEVKCENPDFHRPEYFGEIEIQ